LISPIRCRRASATISPIFSRVIFARFVLRHAPVRLSPPLYDDDDAMPLLSPAAAPPLLADAARRRYRSDMPRYSAAFDIFF